MGDVISLNRELLQQSIQYACPKCGCVHHELFGKCTPDGDKTLEWSRCADCGLRQDLIVEVKGDEQ